MDFGTLDFCGQTTRFAKINCALQALMTKKIVLTEKPLAPKRDACNQLV